jgi:protein tyrosine/serine phosphatase
MKQFCKLLWVIFVLFFFGFIGDYLYNIHYNYNFKEISKGKVYKSGVIPPDEIADYVQKYKIKSIIDLRMPDTKDLKLNPEKVTELQAEKKAVAKIKDLNYFSNPSNQIPSVKNIAFFIQILDNLENYPILIHCYHGTGRAILYSAIYRIEYEKYSNEEARLATRDLVLFSSFDNGTPKGEYLKAYVSRKKSRLRDNF